MGLIKQVRRSSLEETRDAGPRQRVGVSEQPEQPQAPALRRWPSFAQGDARRRVLVVLGAVALVFDLVMFLGTDPAAQAGRSALRAAAAVVPTVAAPLVAPAASPARSPTDLSIAALTAAQPTAAPSPSAAPSAMPGQANEGAGATQNAAAQSKAQAASAQAPPPRTRPAANGGQAPALVPAPAPAPAPATPPVFKLGFATLASLIPDIVGQPLENEHYGANGDSLQQTTKGLLVWRKADNWTAFTNGYMTWVNGPFGLQSRLNTDRFDWEKQ